MTENNDAEERVTDAAQEAAEAAVGAQDDADGQVEEEQQEQEQEPVNGASTARAEDAEVIVEPAGAEPMDELFLSPDDSESEVIEIGDDAVAEQESSAAEAQAAQAVAEANAAAAEELRKLQESHDALEKERDDYKNRMLRVAADLENFRRRATREKEDLRKFGIDKVVLELLPVVDNLERALEHAEKTAEVTSITDGVRMVYRQFVGALEKHGVKGFDSRGEQFDPQRHEAIQQVETDAHDTGTVMEQYQKGYFLHERLIRPALVAVAKRVEGTETTMDPERELPPGEPSDEEQANDAEAPAEEPTSEADDTSDESPSSEETPAD